MTHHPKISQVFQSSLWIAFLFGLQSLSAQNLPSSQPWSFSSVELAQQGAAVEAYLPEVTYDPDVVKPEEVMGHPIGKWHVTHDKLVMVMEEIAETSDRVTFQQIGKTHEDRPIVQLTITSAENHAQLDQIKQNQRNLRDPEVSSSLALEEMPVVVNMNYSIHGNESSGSNAALAVAYFLAAAQGPTVERMLDQSVIVLDPALNPDGLNRFATWANMHKSMHPNGDSRHREYDEVWPGGRTNHYWFDMNRDWLPVTQPESRARIRAFQSFPPNILTDHHEMGTNSTYFFQPGIPSRTNPGTRELNQSLTGKIAEFHAKRLDDIGTLYYSKESFDDFYYGKGSTFPDVQGTIGILFEQASSRGHLQDSQHGLLSFPETIRNQVETSLSSWEAGVSMRVELLDFMRTTAVFNVDRAESQEVKAYIVGSHKDGSKNAHIADIFDHQRIEFFELAQQVTVDGSTFEAGKAWVIPTEQPQAGLIFSLFDESTQFSDSLFYDVSAWTLPYSMDVPFGKLDRRDYESLSLRSIEGSRNWLDQKGEFKTVSPSSEAVGAVFGWDDYYAPALLFHLQQEDVHTKALMKGSTLQSGNETIPLEAGSIWIPYGLQDHGKEHTQEIIREATSQFNVSVHEVSSGLALDGIDLGSPSIATLEAPNVAILGGEGTSSYEAGEMWFLFDQRMELPVTVLDNTALYESSFDGYTHVFLPTAYLGSVDAPWVDGLKSWVRGGGTLIVQRGAVSWARRAGLHSTETTQREPSTETPARGVYANASNDRGAGALGGAIFKAEADFTHPLLYGVDTQDNWMPLFKNSNGALVVPDNPYASPLIYTEDPLAAGYMHPESKEMIAGHAALVVENSGRGEVILFADNPNFRAFWMGTQRLTVNSVVFGPSL
ncbi:MAG: M14 family zinc carboxypeptidase [Balneolaceae bacterium]|nr:M14 family zinc carboxypeptidase [Balneolaceae bacterium]